MTKLQLAPHAIAVLDGAEFFKQADAVRARFFSAAFHDDFSTR